MADDEELSDAELEEQPEKAGVDYEELDEQTGFKKVEWNIWQSYCAAVLDKPEDEREDEEEWSENYATENSIDKNRITTVVKLGLYAGERDAFNQRTGEGRCIYSNSDTYEGHYWEGKKNGKGKYVFKSLGKGEVDKLLDAYRTQLGDQYDDAGFIAAASDKFDVGSEIVKTFLELGPYPCYNGEYVNNLRHGAGVMKNKDGTVYRGQWKDNKRHGWGVYYYVNGDKYEGDWVDGYKHGSGCYTFAKSKGEYSGRWEKGVFKEGQWRMTDGTFYEGQFDNKNRPCDVEGAVKFPRLGLMQTGEYKKGVWAPKFDLLVTANYTAEATDPTI
jgi:hypothetical protein